MDNNNKVKNSTDIEYNRVLKKLLDKCESNKDNIRQDRTGTGTISLFSEQTRYNFENGFPILTNKKVYFHGVKVELLWFLGNHLKIDKYKDLGRTNIKYLVDNNVNIWTEWCLDNYLKDNNIFINNKDNKDEWSEYMNRFTEKIKSDDIEFIKKYGSIGEGAYGKQWRDFNGTDQISNVIELLKNNKTSRRILVSAWNPSEIDKALLPPCHIGFQFYVENDKLSIHFNMRSNDYFLGNPFNISSYALLLAMVSHIVGLKPHEVVGTYTDCHLYSNHIEQAYTQLNREIIYDTPYLILNENIKDIDSFTIDDISLSNYQSYKGIKADIAV